MENKEQKLYNTFYQLNIDLKKGDQCMRLSKEDVSIIAKALSSLDGISEDIAKQEYSDHRKQMEENRIRFEKENPGLFTDF